MTKQTYSINGLHLVAATEVINHVKKLHKKFSKLICVDFADQCLISKVKIMFETCDGELHTFYYKATYDFGIRLDTDITLDTINRIDMTEFYAED